MSASTQNAPRNDVLNKAFINTSLRGVEQSVYLKRKSQNILTYIKYNMKKKSPLDKSEGLLQLAIFNFILLLVSYSTVYHQPAIAKDKVH